MPDFFKKIVETQGTVEQVVRRIPGFRGYFEREDRRMADRLLREKLALVMEEQLGEFTRLQKRLVDGGGIGYMERVRGVDSKLRTFIDKIESAGSGYAGLFDAVKIDEAALARVYAFDTSLLAYGDQLAAGLKRLGEAIGSDDVGEVLDGLEVVVGEAVNTFNHRVEAMRGMQDAV